MTLLRIAVLALVGLLPVAVTVNPVAAQTIPSNYRRIERSQEAGPIVGSFAGGTGRFDFGPNTGVLFGARYGVEIGGPFSFEGSVGFVDGTRNVIDPELSEGSRLAGEADIQMLLAEARFRFALTGRRTWRRISPHLIFGAGVASDFAGTQAADERILESDRFTFGTAFTAVGGGGFRFFLNDTWSARADGEVHIWRLQTPPGYGEANRGFENVEESEWTNNFTFNVGLAYRF